MHKLIAHPDGIHAVDTGYSRPQLAAVHIIIDNGCVALVDTGHNAAVPRVLAALGALGVAPEAIEWVILTHVHLDHAGGAGSLLGALPRARLLVHPRGVRHMLDPAKLWEGTAAVYGFERAFELYGTLVPVDADRVVPATEGMEIQLGKRTLRVFDTPGHARHHIAIWDDEAHAFFTGDAFGVSYREFDVGERAFAIPTTTPTQFDPDAMHSSIDRMLAMQPEAMYLTHYSRIVDVQRIGSDLHRLLDTMVAVARAARGDGVARHVEILAGLEQVIREEAARQNWAVDEEKTLELLRSDLELNAQGLGVWLDHLRELEAVPA